MVPCPPCPMTRDALGSTSEWSVRRCTSAPGGRRRPDGVHGVAGTYDDPHGEPGKPVEDRLEELGLPLVVDGAEADQHERLPAAFGRAGPGRHHAGVADVGRQPVTPGGVELAVGGDQHAVGGVPQPGGTHAAQGGDGPDRAAAPAVGHVPVEGVHQRGGRYSRPLCGAQRPEAHAVGEDEVDGFTLQLGAHVLTRSRVGEHRDVLDEHARPRRRGRRRPRPCVHVGDQLPPGVRHGRALLRMAQDADRVAATGQLRADTERGRDVAAPVPGDDQDPCHLSSPRGRRAPGPAPVGASAAPWSWRRDRRRGAAASTCTGRSRRRAGR